MPRSLRFWIILGWLGIAVSAEAREAKDHPNIVIMFVDQLRWCELGCYSNPVIHSPNLDRLASEGVQFTKGFTNFPSCSPARSILLSGRYARSNGVYANQGPAPIDSRPTNRDTTMPEALAAQGYTTALIGKWHLDPHPRLLGFQKSWIGGTGPAYDGYMRGPWKVDGDPSGDYIHEGWTLDHQAELADRFLRQNKDKPFFLYLTPSPPHMPIASLPEKYKAMYDPEKMPLRPNVWVNDELPYDPRWFGIYLGENKPPELPKGITLRNLYALYYGQITAVDDWVGKVLKSIHDQGLDENTIVMFSADHGDLLGSHHQFNKNEHYDEASRIPFLIRWNGMLKPTVQDAQIISQVDVAPTFLDLCGVKSPESVQGTSLAPVLLGKQSTIGENVAYIETTVNEGIRTDRYVYWCRRHGKDHEHLFDTSSDPFEINDVIEDPRYKEVVAELREKTSKWQSKTPSVHAPASHPAEGSLPTP